MAHALCPRAAAARRSPGRFGTMKLRLLLVVASSPLPCTADTASRSVGFRAAAGALEVYDTEIVIVDMKVDQYSERLAEDSGAACPGRVSIDGDDFRSRVSASLPFHAALVIIGSDPWCYGAQEAVELLKGLSPGSPVILCGDHPNLWYDQAVKTTGADYIHRGPLVSDYAFVFRTFGFRLRRKRGQKR